MNRFSAVIYVTIYAIAALAMSWVTAFFAVHGDWPAAAVFAAFTQYFALGVYDCYLRGKSVSAWVHMALLAFRVSAIWLCMVGWLLPYRFPHVFILYGSVTARHLLCVSVPAYLSCTAIEVYSGDRENKSRLISVSRIGARAGLGAFALGAMWWLTERVLCLASNS